MFYFLDLKNEKDITAIYVFNEKNNKIVYIRLNNLTLREQFKPIFEDETILKCGTHLKEDWRALKENGIDARNMMFDVHVAAYLLDSTKGKYNLENLSQEYLNFDILTYNNDNNANDQMNLFETEVQKLDERKCAYVFVIYKLYDILKR